MGTKPVPTIPADMMRLPTMDIDRQENLWIRYPPRGPEMKIVVDNKPL